MLFLRPLSFFIFFFLGINVYVFSQKQKSVLQRKYPPLALQKDAEIFSKVALKNPGYRFLLHVHRRNLK
jgi:cbb3-type cytochrome oxidase subunit 3